MPPRPARPRPARCLRSAAPRAPARRTPSRCAAPCRSAGPACRSRSDAALPCNPGDGTGPLASTPTTRAGALHHALDRVENILLARKRHLQVELREFELAVGAKILVAETPANLKVAVHVGNHQDLLEDLRRLRQRVELPVMNAARHQAIARAFGRRARQHRRFDLEKAQLVERLANLEERRDAAARYFRAGAGGADRDSGSAAASLRSRSLRLRSETAASSNCSECAGAWRPLPPRRWRFRDSISAAESRGPRPRPRIPTAALRPWRAPRDAAPC